MGGKARSIRNSARAIIIENNRLLVVQQKDSRGTWYMLPGGGQESNETLPEALVRESVEEIGASVEVGPLLLIREYFSCNHEFASKEHDCHYVEFMFLCKLGKGEIARQGSTPDVGQTGIAWLPIETIREQRLYPQAIRERIRNIGQNELPVYMGDVD